jgi:hypothetical protein
MDEEFELDSLFLSERKCRVCGEIKDLMDGFYLTHKDSTDASSAYSYECKTCTIKRITKKRKSKKHDIELMYPDW